MQAQAWAGRPSVCKHDVLRIINRQGSKRVLSRSEVLPLAIAGGLSAAVIAAVLLTIHYVGPGRDNMLQRWSTRAG